MSYIIDIYSNFFQSLSYHKHKVVFLFRDMPVNWQTNRI